jgi:hypothetical protein
MRRLLVMAAAAVALATGAAFAGEVKGPGGGVNTDYTAARENANSLCAFSGLNDFVGPGTTFVQTPAFQFSGGAPGAPGTACQGGSNFHNP